MRGSSESCERENPRIPPGGIESITWGQRGSLLPRDPSRWSLMRGAGQQTTGELLWEPPPDARRNSEVGRFLDWLSTSPGRPLDRYDDLWRWSVEDLEGFWAAIWDFYGVRAT